MKIENLVNTEIKRKLGYNNDSKRKRKKNHHKRNQHDGLTEREIKYLMGQYMPTYKRGRGGVIRQR